MVSFETLIQQYHSLLSNYLPKLKSTYSGVSVLEYGPQSDIRQKANNQLCVEYVPHTDPSKGHFLISNRQKDGNMHKTQASFVFYTVEDAAMYLMNTVMNYHLKETAMVMSGKANIQSLRHTKSEWQAYDLQGRWVDTDNEKPVSLLEL